MPAVGQILPVALKLFDDAADQFVKATVRDPDGVEVSGSPYSLTHVGEGLYHV